MLPSPYWQALPQPREFNKGVTGRCFILTRPWCSWCWALCGISELRAVTFRTLRGSEFAHWTLGSVCSLTAVSTVYSGLDVSTRVDPDQSSVRLLKSICPQNSRTRQMESRGAQLLKYHRNHSVSESMTDFFFFLNCSRQSKFLQMTCDYFNKPFGPSAGGLAHC